MSKSEESFDDLISCDSCGDQTVKASNAFKISTKLGTPRKTVTFVTPTKNLTPIMNTPEEKKDDSNAEVDLKQRFKLLIDEVKAGSLSTSEKSLYLDLSAELTMLLACPALYINETTNDDKSGMSSLSHKSNSSPRKSDNPSPHRIDETEDSPRKKDDPSPHQINETEALSRKSIDPFPHQTNETEDSSRKSGAPSTYQIAETEEKSFLLVTATSIASPVSNSCNLSDPKSATEEDFGTTQNNEEHFVLTSHDQASQNTLSHQSDVLSHNDSTPHQIDETEGGSFSCVTPDSLSYSNTSY